MLRWQQEMPRPGNLKQWLTSLTCLDSPRSRLASKMQFPGMTRISKSMKMMTMNTFEEDVDWYAGDCDVELDDTAYTAGTPTDDPELLEQFDGHLEDADAPASQVYASASRSFQEERELLSRVKSARGYFPVFGIGAFDGLAQPSTDRKPAKSRGKGKKGKRKRKSVSQKRWKTDKPGHTWHFAKITELTCRVSSSGSVRLMLAQLVVDHITLLVIVLISACCVDWLDIVLQNVPTKGNRLLFHLEKVH